MILWFSTDELWHSPARACEWLSQQEEFSEDWQMYAIYKCSKHNSIVRILLNPNSESLRYPKHCDNLEVVVADDPSDFYYDTVPPDDCEWDFCGFEFYEHDRYGHSLLSNDMQCFQQYPIVDSEEIMIKSANKN